MLLTIIFIQFIQFNYFVNIFKPFKLLSPSSSPSFIITLNNFIPLYIMSSPNYILKQTVTSCLIPSKPNTPPNTFVKFIQNVLFDYHLLSLVDDYIPLYNHYKSYIIVNNMTVNSHLNDIIFNRKTNQYLFIDSSLSSVLIINKDFEVDKMTRLEGVPVKMSSMGHEGNVLVTIKDRNKKNVVGKYTSDMKIIDTMGKEDFFLTVGDVSYNVLDDTILVSGDSTNKNGLHLFTSSQGSLLRSFGKDLPPIKDIYNVNTVQFDDERKRIITSEGNTNKLNTWSSDGSTLIQSICFDSPVFCLTMDDFNRNKILVGSHEKVLILDCRKNDKVLDVIDYKNRYSDKSDFLGMCVDNQGQLICIDNNNYLVGYLNVSNKHNEFYKI